MEKKERVIFKGLETVICKTGWFKMLLIRVFGKTYHGVDSDNNGIYIVTFKQFREVMYCIKDEYWKAPMDKLSKLMGQGNEEE